MVIDLQKIDFSKIGTYLLTISENAVELVVSLIALIIVGRAFGQQGLGIFSYLLSLYFIAGYFSELGIPRFVERNIAIHTGNKNAQAEVLSRAFQSTFWVGCIGIILFIIFAGYCASHTRIEERLAAYLIIGLTIPIRNFNGLKLALMHGNGQHDGVAKLQTKKRLIFLASVYFLSKMNIPPSYLTLGFFISELALMKMARKQAKLPKIKSVFSKWNRIRPTLSESGRFLFTDDALDVLLYIDFLILGLFISSLQLGVYAEASILARFFLLIPVSIKPVFRQEYCLPENRGNPERTASMIHRSAALIFFLHAVLGLYILLYFEDVMRIFSHEQGTDMISFSIFKVIFPGLLLFSAVISQEPLYEAEGKVSTLQEMVIVITGINLAMNLYLIPFAGFFGAASATTISMLIYFFLFGRHLPKMYIIDKLKYVCAGAAVYLTYMVKQWAGFGFAVSFWLTPLMLFTLFYFMDFFKFEKT